MAKPVRAKRRTGALAQSGAARSRGKDAGRARLFGETRRRCARRPGCAGWAVEEFMDVTGRSMGPKRVQLGSIQFHTAVRFENVKFEIVLNFYEGHVHILDLVLRFFKFPLKIRVVHGLIPWHIVSRRSRGDFISKGGLVMGLAFYVICQA